MKCANCKKEVHWWNSKHTSNFPAKYYCSKECKEIFLKKTPEEQRKDQPPLNKKVLVAMACVAILLTIMLIGGLVFSPSGPQPTVVDVRSNAEYVNVEDLYALFGSSSPLTDIQKEDLFNTEYKNKYFSTVIRADDVYQMSFSTDYVIRQQNGYLQFGSIKAFFPSSEKDKLLNIDKGTPVVITGKLTEYNSILTNDIIFNDARVVEVK